MSNLLFEAKRNTIRALTIFPSSLKIYDDYITFHTRKWFNTEEVTMTTTNIAQVNIKSGLFFSTIQVTNSSGAENATIQHVWKPTANKAKEILDQKLYDMFFSDSTSREEGKQIPVKSEFSEFEKALGRMRELVNRGKMSEKEYESKRRALLKKIG